MERPPRNEGANAPRFAEMVPAAAERGTATIAEHTTVDERDV